MAPELHHCSTAVWHEEPRRHSQHPQGAVLMTFGKYISRSVAIAALSTFACAGASAATINFDQDSSAATGSFSYDGQGGGLVGQGISFSFVSADTGTGSKVNCVNCALNFVTGDNISEGDSVGTNYAFGSGGSFTLTGEVVNGGSSIASGTLLDGEFTGTPNLTRASNRTGLFSAIGVNTVNDELASFFGIESGADFTFATTEFSFGELAFNGDNGFSGNVTAADLQTGTDVPEPQELAIFGLGLVLLVGGIAARRRSTDGDLIG
ncbi:hypothetical protein [Salinisphaera orenii]|uniref:hypothetical protein n=1 Tax=Salinisphaera orenii TaxID=856731 RepID=UPI0011CE14F4|nr:hypothetical protein [Salinisphaera halophila]